MAQGSGLLAAQWAVFVVRDVEGLPAAETCRLLGLTEGNQRVLLHRGRSKVTAAAGSLPGSGHPAELTS